MIIFNIFKLTDKEFEEYLNTHIDNMDKDELLEKLKKCGLEVNMTNKEIGKLLDELNEIRLENLSEKARKLFNTIIYILDTRDAYIQSYEEDEQLLKTQDKIIKLLVADMQAEGYFKDMKFEEIIEYYKKRKDVLEEG